MNEPENNFNGFIILENRGVDIKCILGLIVSTLVYVGNNNNWDNFSLTNGFEKIKVDYQDVNGENKTLEAEGLLAICIQHEYDHVDGILFTDHLSPLKKRMLKKKLINISKGDVDIKYKMKFPLIKKRR